MIDLTLNMVNGDCELINDDDNMIEASIRRLNTELDSTLYEEYGSTLSGLRGYRKTDVNLEFLEQTISECLLQDERITECNVECEYTIDGFTAQVTIVYEENELEFTYESSSNEDNVGEE